MAGLLPSLLLALFGAWCGTFAWGPLSPASAAATVSLLAALVWAGPSWRDPLRLGLSGRLLPLALWIAVAASAWGSPVSRAGWVAVLLLPAFFALPAAVERCWRRESDRRWGLRALSMVVGGVSLWSLVDWLLGTPRPSMPLGHHNLLAAWLVILLPLAVLPSRESGPWRLAGLAAGALALYAILASRSLTGFAALALEALAGFGGRARPQQRRWWAVLLALALLVSFLQLPRILRIAAGEDPSARARAAYWASGWEGFRARPLLGWGPGSAAWTSAAFRDPIPRVNPWGESVGELHSLPLQLGYELGCTGLLLAVGVTVLFFARRFGEREEGRDPALLAGGLLGLGGGAITSLGSGAIAVTAIPLAAAVAAGAALAGSGRGRGRRESQLPVRIYAVLALLALGPLELARWHYDRAVIADTRGAGQEAATELAAAVRLDPAFPLYPLRLALLRSRPGGGSGDAPELGLRAAEQGLAVPVSWLVAGALGYSGRRPWAGSALATACALDPQDPFPPYYEMLLDPTGADAPSHGAHALLAEPRLAAALFWERHPELFRRALLIARAWPEVDAGWKEALPTALLPPAARQGPAIPLELTIDTQPAETLSLPIFRRRPWPTRWGLVEVRKSVWERLRLPPAAAAKGTSARFLHAAPCLRRARLGQALLTH
jgi:O-antigen ligase